MTNTTTTATFGTSALTTSFQGDLMPHQTQALDWLIDHPRRLLADDVGLGKTIEALALICHLKDTGHMWAPAPFRVVWVTDASLVQSTREKAERFAPTLSVLTPTDPLGKMTGTAQLVRRDACPFGVDLYILSYEQLHSWRNSFPKLFVNPFMFVLDEAMSVKGGGAKFEALRVMSAGAERTVAMTATPYENHPMETYSVLRAIGVPGLWPRKTFEDEFVEWQPGYQLPTGGWVRPKPLGFLPGKDEELREFLADCMLRRTADDVGLELPARVGERCRWVPLTEEQQRAYAAADRKVGLSRFAARERAGKLAGPESGLIDALFEELKRRPDEKVIVACETLAVVEMVARRLDAAGIGNRRIEGKTKKSERDTAIDAFREDPSVRILVGSRVLERGLDLQFARVLISLDSSYNPQREHQREGRICRIGSPHTTFQHLTLLPDTPHVRTKIAAVAHKRDSAETLLGLRL